MTTHFSVTDLFCGAGGSSLGARQAGRGDSGVQIRIASNHWWTAVNTHAENFPDTEHDCADISQTNPRRYPTTTMLIASPECTNYTRAKGRQRANLHESDLWGERQLTDAEERSRVTMWDPIRFAEHHRYQFVIIENVVDIRLWVLYEAWLKAWTDLGYEYQELYWNSMFFYPTPQSRDRYYLVLWRKGMKRPHLDHRPLGWCQACQRDTETIQSWKKPTRKHGKWGARNQYVYCCPTCAGEVTPYYYCAANAVDWSIPTIRIGDRETHGLKPLVQRTRDRIQVGLDKFAGRPSIVDFVHSGGAAWMVRGVESPMPTQLGNRTLGLTVPPFLMSLTHAGGHNNRAYPIDGPAPTQTTGQDYSLVVPPFLLGTAHTGGGNNRAYAVDGPTPTMTGTRTYGVVVPPFAIEFRGGSSNARGLDEPLSTVTAGGHHHGLAVPPFISSYYGQGGETPLDAAMPTVTGKDHHSLVVPPFLLSYYGGRDALQSLEQPVPTLPTMNRHAVVEPGQAVQVDDCGFRMFKVSEIKRAMAFPDDYKLLGNQDDQVKLCGNAVTPPPMRRMVEACLAVFSEAGRS
jgi:DNA (cytosine-5)-methyltransferase 1